MLLWAYSLKTARLSMGCSLAGWKNSATRITIIPRSSTTAPILVVIAASPPPTCRPLGCRASIAASSPFQRGTDPKPRVQPALIKQAHYTPLVAITIPQWARVRNLLGELPRTLLPRCWVNRCIGGVLCVGVG
jgi:hypothetical protein